VETGGRLFGYVAKKGKVKGQGNGKGKGVKRMLTRYAS